MKLPYNWLKEFVETNESAGSIADKLTMVGLEVEEVLSAASFENIVVGEVLRVEKHPNADKLRVAQVNVGDKELQIVCGAPNLEKGQKVPVALVGAKIGDFEIKKATLRGIDSEGMICSEKELGISDDHDGIMVLPSESVIGDKLSGHLEAEEIIDVNIPANRPDCMGVLGLSREVAVCLKAELKTKLPTLREVDQKTDDIANVVVEDFSLCSRYEARIVRNLTISESPDWLKEKLSSCGIRPINNLVDISNYVMLALGQPLHFFDLDKIDQKEGKAEIIVRAAKNGEKLTTIDGEERDLADGMLLIADKEKPIAIAGVMGGNNSEIDENTKNILVEAAVFNKASIRRTARALGLRTEAVARFEKGVPFNLPDIAIDHAAHLLAEIANGEVCSGKIDVFEKKKEAGSLEVDSGKINKFLGSSISLEEIESILLSLGFKIDKNNDKFIVTPPWWREDILVSADVYEEVARIYGYDRITSTLPSTGDTIPKQNKMYQFTKGIRTLLSSLGMTEILTYSFLGKKELIDIGENISMAPRIANPLVSTQEYMRTSLLPGILTALRNNQFNKETLQFFEIGNVFVNKSEKELPEERKWLSGGVIGGISWPITYTDGNDFYVAKGLVDNLLASNSFTSERIEFRPSENTIYNQGRACDIIMGEVVIGSIGEVKRQILNDFDIKKDAAVFLIDLDKLFSFKTKEVSYQAFSKFPKVVRDISFIVDNNKNVQDLLDIVNSSDELVSSTEVIDIYRGKLLSENKKSITIRIDIQSEKKTLNENDIDIVTNKIISLIEANGGKVRSGSGNK